MKKRPKNWPLEKFLPDHSTAQNCIGGAAHGGVTLDIPSAKMYKLISITFKMFLKH